jgi:membrane protease YdiL (CAAX protease family)
MKRSLVVATAATAAAIAVTSAMDASGLTAFSALPLFPLAAIVLLVSRLPSRGAGLRWGAERYHLWAAAYPIVVIGLCAAIALGAGAATLSRVDWSKALGNVALVAVATILVALITEEGFFRGALWAVLRDAGLGRRKTLFWTSVAFALWHISAVTLHTGFDLPRAQVPLFLVNAALMGAIWGTLRLVSGSILVSSVSHGLWNGLAYGLFAYGGKVGALGVARTDIFGPEVGVVGVTLNALAIVAILLSARRQFSDAAPTAPVQVVIAP